MENQISHLIKKLCEGKKAEEYGCDTTSSTVHIVNAPVPSELFHELEGMSAMFNRDVDCLAGELLAIALREAILSMSKGEHDHLDEVRDELDRVEAVRHADECKFDAGGS